MVNNAAKDVDVQEVRGQVVVISKYLTEFNHVSILLQVPGRTMFVLFRDRIGAILSALVRDGELVGVTYHQEQPEGEILPYNVGHDLWYIEQPKDFKKRHTEAVRQAEAILLRASLGLTESQKPEGQEPDILKDSPGRLIENRRYIA